jgi:drug/metabolite transporter (DMT)-like permease
MLNRQLLSIFIYSVLYSAIITIQRILLLQGAHPIFINLIMYLVAVIIFSSIIGITNPKLFRIQKNQSSDIKWTILSAFTALMADLLALFGLQTGSSITWSILICVSPIITYILALLFLNDKLAKAKIIAIGLSVIGAIMVIYTPISGISLSISNILFIGAVCLYGISNILNQKALNNLNVNQFTWIRLVASTFFMFIAFLMIQPKFVPVNWWLVMLTGVIALAATRTMNLIIQNYGATFFALGVNLTPVMTAILAIIFIHDFPTAYHVLGGVVIVGSIYIFINSKNRNVPISGN